MSRSDFASLIKDVANNLDNKDYQTKINNYNYDLKNSEQFLLKIITKKISKKESRELCKILIEPEVDKLRNAKGKGKNKRSNFKNILENMELSIFDGVYLHYLDNSIITKESIAERTNLRRQRLNIV